MTIIIVCIFFILTIYLLFKTNILNNNIEVNKFLFILKSSSKGFLLYSFLGYITAYIIIEVMGDGRIHPHSMLGLLYFFLPLFSAGVGFSLGIIYSVLNKKSINKKLIYSIPVYPLILGLFILYMDYF